MVCRDFDLFADVPARLPLEEFSGLIVLGGPMSANDTKEYPFLEPELDWIREAVEAQVPILGICLGANCWPRLWARRSTRIASRRSAGTRLKSCRQPPPTDCSARGATETVFQWHGDTFDLPAGAVHLARSELCPNQAFRYGPCATAFSSTWK